MKLKRIGYQHSFQVTQFLYDKIYFEAELEPGDTEEQAVQELIDKCKEVERRVSDGVNGSDYKCPLPSSPLTLQDYETLAVKQMEKYGGTDQTSTTIGITAESIKSCQQLMMLEKVYFPLIDKMKDKEKQRELWIAYDERYAQLANIQSIKQ